MIEQEENVKPIYERLDNEPSAWFSRFLVYRNMQNRSLLGAYKLFQARKGTEKHYKQVPGAWKEASEKYDWKFRAELYDDHIQAEIAERQRILFEAEQAEIERILTTDYAQKHKRIAGLARMAHIIENSFIEDGEINYKFLNPDKVREYRGCLDDIAKELGERVKKSEVTGKDGGPLEFVTDWGGGIIEEEDNA